MAKKKKSQFGTAWYDRPKPKKDQEDIRKTFQNRKKEIINPTIVKADNGK